MNLKEIFKKIDSFLDENFTKEKPEKGSLFVGSENCDENHTHCYISMVGYPHLVANALCSYLLNERETGAIQFRQTVQAAIYNFCVRATNEQIVRFFSCSAKDGENLATKINERFTLASERNENADPENGQGKK